jgi:uncharacterized Zn finger protein/superfamily II DNA or RNA helicase
MAKDFGKTWWGSEWLQSLQHIDYENRIPRGARYARNGYVRSVSIVHGAISAKVDGSRPTPYKVAVKVKPFTDKEKKALIDGILEHPVIVSELLCHRLSPAVSDIAQSRHLKVFPTSWRDLGMNCNCPDWAVPCKHIAAVIYMVSKEIDNNPFLIFELHGADILAELEQRGIHALQDSKVEVPEWNEAMEIVKPSNAKVKETPNSLPHFDFTTIVGLGDTMRKLLPIEPPFWSEGDFMALYSENARRAAKTAKTMLQGKRSVADHFELTTNEPASMDSGDPSLVVDKRHQVSVKFGKQAKLRSLSDLMRNLEALPTPDLLNSSNTTYAFHTCFTLALHLAVKGNAVPTICANSKNSYDITWAPFVGDSQTAEILRQTDTLFAKGDIRVGGVSASDTPRHPAWFATAFFLTALVRVTAKPRTNASKVYDMFYKGGLYRYDGMGEQAVPISIKSWIDHLRAPQSHHTPLLTLREDSVGSDRFLLDLSVVEKQEYAAPISLRSVFSDETYKTTRYTILKELSSLSGILPVLDDYLAHEASKPIAMSSDEMIRFLMDTVPALRLLNIQVALPKSLRHLIRPLPSIALSTKPNDGKKFLRLDQLLQFDWKVAIGDELVSPDEFERMVGRAEQLVRFKQQYVYVSADNLKRIEKALTARNEMTPARMLQVALSGEYKTARVNLSPEVRELLKQWTTQQEIDVPAEIRATPRPYQKRGYEWMYQNMRLGFGSVLADDMGLGKTLQVIMLLQKVANEGMLSQKRALVVAPTGLLANWEAELQRFAPTMTVFLYHGTGRKVTLFDHHIMLTSYGTLRSDVEKIKKMKWAAIVIDEAQNIKNSSTSQSKAVKAIKADIRIAMSGTPVENRLSEYWSVMDFANKGYLGSLKAFNEEYAKPIQQSGDKACAERFRKITAPMMMRRLKTDKSIISDLPEKIQQDEYAMLTPKQAALYTQVLEESMKVIEGVDENEKGALFKRQGLVLQMVLALKQICNHPTQYLKNGVMDASLSGKTEMLLDLVSSIDDSGEKALIFTQYTEMGDMLQRFIAETTGTTPMFLHGGCSIKQRKEMVERFQNNRSDRIFILSLKAAGTGLNLTAASHVIHYDLWWNPAVEAQATDRAYRIGQKQNVMVHRFITRDTFEERINDMINEKRALANMTVAVGESWIGKLSNKELRELFT